MPGAFLCAIRSEISQIAHFIEAADDKGEQPHAVGFCFLMTARARARGTTLPLLVNEIVKFFLKFGEILGSPPPRRVRPPAQYLHARTGGRACTGAGAGAQTRTHDAR